MNKLKLMLIMMLVFVQPVASVAAQSSVPPVSATPSVPTISISGKIVNQTPGGSVPQSLELILHAWDQQDYSEKLMVNGQSKPDGTFQFEAVPLDTNLVYGVMATYNGVNYFSTPVPAEGHALDNIEVAIYESTADASKVQIDRAHVLFLAAHAGLQVVEVYSLSNPGDRTIQGALKLADGKLATIEFPLPAEAVNVTFNPEEADRFVRTPIGFADTAPLGPGSKSGQVIVNYILPYQSGLTYTYAAQLPTGGLNFLVDQSSGLSVTGEGLTDGGAQPMGDGSQFSILTHDALQPGEKATVTLAGELKVNEAAQPAMAAANSTSSSPTGPNPAVAIGGIIIGLALAAFGIWYFRKPDPVLATVEPASDTSFKSILTQIALLDESHEQGEMDADTYQARRAELMQTARTLMQMDETS
jgi:hypothetical protein